MAGGFLVVGWVCILIFCAHATDIAHGRWLPVLVCEQVLIYGVLDVISKAVFGLILMSGASTGYEAI